MAGWILIFPSSKILSRIYNMVKWFPIAFTWKSRLFPTSLQGPAFSGSSLYDTPLITHCSPLLSALQSHWPLFVPWASQASPSLRVFVFAFSFAERVSSADSWLLLIFYVSAQMSPTQRNLPPPLYLKWPHSFHTVSPLYFLHGIYLNFYWEFVFIFKEHTIEN